MFKWVACVCFFVMCSSLFAKTLTLSGFLNQINQSTTYHERLTAQYTSQVIANGSYRALNDWALESNLSHTSGMDIQGFPMYGNKMIADQLDWGASRIFSSTGSRFSVLSTFSQTLNSPELFPSISNPDIRSLTLSASLSQPLIQNAGGLLDRLPKQLAEIQDHALAELLRNQKNQLKHAHILAYLKWVLNAQTVQIAVKQVKKADSQAALVTALYARGAAESIAKIQSQRNQEAKELFLYQSQENLRSSRIEIASILQLAPTASFSYWPNSDDFADWGDDLNLKDALAAIETLHSISRLDDQIAIQSLRVLEAKEKLKPSVDAFVSQSIGSKQTEISDMLSKFGENTGLTFGMSYSGFADTIQAQIAHDVESIQLSTLQLIRKETYYAIAQNIKLLMNTLNSATQQIQQLSQVLVLANQAAEEEYKKYSMGRSQSQFFVLQAQDQALATEMQLTGLTVQRLIIANQLYYLLDQYPTIKGLPVL